MISSWRGLAIAGALAVVLAIWVALDLARSPELVDRAVVPGFDADRVTELVWQRAGQPDLRAVRAGDRWALGSVPPAIPADPTAISDVLAALRGARWHRRGGAVASHAILAVIGSGGRTTIGIGAPIEGVDQSWLAIGDRGLVVDRWVARALDRDPLSLRIRTPFAAVRGAERIAIGAGSASPIELIGHPRQRTAPHVLPSAELVVELERALAEITIVRLPGTAIRPSGLAIALAAATDRDQIRLVLGGACPGAAELVAISGTTGDGCVERAAAEAVERAADRLAQPAAAIAERRPIPFDIQRIVLVDGIALETSPPRIAGGPADPVRVSALFAALALPCEIVPLPSAPAPQHLVVADRAGAAITLDLYAGGVVARRGEPIALRPAPGAWDPLVWPSRALRQIALWLEEPTTVSELAIDGVHYRRGAVIGAWTRQPPGPIDPARVEAAVAELAAPSPAAADGPLRPAHHVAITVTPPIGAAQVHALELGAAPPTGCGARVAAEIVALPAGLCREIAALAK